ncbi:expressed unknown protein [Seminavis robusta]|uniref:Uncharacterized protein n=1 Tax=Seminavis robusta TaxID=568900 RepID=A0A9N8DW97_9STRA|nr:expressed unknown protein [Seminavis robusta]|eukprot:Sro423_g139800.1 n/a (202) ;mRNA; r:30425-31030
MNPTASSDEGGTQGATKKSVPLFAIPENRRTSNEEKQQGSNETKVAPLFSIPKKSMPSELAATNTKKRPLFALPNHTDEDHSMAKKPASASGIEDSSKKPPLFSIPVSPSAGVNNDKPGATTNAPLFSIPVNPTSGTTGGRSMTSALRNPNENHTKQAARPPLFQIPGKAGSKDASKSQSGSSEKDSRPQRPLFDIGTSKR